MMRNITLTYNRNEILVLIYGLQCGQTLHISHCRSLLYYLYDLCHILCFGPISFHNFKSLEYISGGSLLLFVTLRSHTLFEGKVSSNSRVDSSSMCRLFSVMSHIVLEEKFLALIRSDCSTMFDAFENSHVMLCFWARGLCGLLQYVVKMCFKAEKVHKTSSTTAI